MTVPPPSARTTIRWGILGCGDVTEVKSGPGFQKAAGSKLVAVMLRNGALAADYARRHGVPRWYDDARKLIADPEVDAVYIATPPGSHLELARLVAAAGKPCYVEKPMARNTPECDAMIDAFRAAKQKLFAAYYRRAQPRFLGLKQLIDTGALGQVTSIAYRLTMGSPNPDAKGGWRIDATTAGGGLLLDMGSHMLDLLDYFFGPLTPIHGDAARLGSSGQVEDVVTMIFRTPTGIPGAAVWNFTSHAREDRLEITGTAGRVSCSVFGTEPLALETAAGAQSLAFPPLEHAAQPLIQTVVDDLLGRGTCPSTGESARRTSAVMDTVLASFYGGREDAFWTRPNTWPGLQPATRA